MRIEAGEHPVDRAFLELVVVDFLDVAQLDQLVDGGEPLELGGRARIDRGEAGGGRRDQRNRTDQQGGAKQGNNLHGSSASGICASSVAHPYRALRVNARWRVGGEFWGVTPG